MKLENIGVSFGNKKVIDDLTLELPEKGMIFIMAPSGYGKTTLLYVLTGLKKPDSGSVTGRYIRRSVVFQEDRLFPWLTVAENAALPMERPDEAQEWLKKLGIDEQNAYPKQLSGGMQRRVSLAAALAYDGDAYFLDEPTRGLDAGNAALVLKFLKEKSRHKPVIIATHSDTDADMYGDYIVRFSSTPLCRCEISHPERNSSDNR